MCKGRIWSGDFALGYAPNREGKLSLIFGLLGKSGAENRLMLQSREQEADACDSSMLQKIFALANSKKSRLALLRDFNFCAKQSKNPSLEVDGISTQVMKLTGV